MALADNRGGSQVTEKEELETRIDVLGKQARHYKIECERLLDAQTLAIGYIEDFINLMDPLPVTAMKLAKKAIESLK